MDRRHPSVAAALALAVSFSAVAQEPLKIGFSMSLTGPLGGNGRAALLAMQMWAEDVNTKGGLLGRPIRLVYYDDQTNPANVPGLYTKLLDIDKVDLIVSSYGTDVIAPAMRATQPPTPDRVFVASYPPDSAGIVRAANEVALKTRQFGGAMIGVQYATLKTQLGPLLNGVVAWEVYAPEPTIKFPGVEEFLARYQPLAAAQQLDPLGFFLPPYAYAMMQIVGEAVQRVGKIDQSKIAEDIHSHEFTTVVGNGRV